MTTQEAVQGRTRGLGMDEFAGDDQKVIQGQQQGTAQLDHHRFLGLV
jgi:hypothetical protein